MATGARGNPRGKLLTGALDVSEASGLSVGGTSITATPAELNILDGATVTAAELNQLDQSAHSSSASLTEGVGLPLFHSVSTYDFAVDGGSQGAIAIGDALPDNALVLGGFVDVETTCTDGASDTATIALSIVGANDIVSAIAINDGSNPWDAGQQAIIPKFNTPESTSVKLTAANQVDVTIATADLTAGKFHVHLFYVLSF